MRIVNDAWLSEVLGQPAFSVVDVSAEAVPSIRPHAQAVTSAFYYAKLDAVEVAAMTVLQRAGFRTVEASLTFARSTFGELASATSRSPVTVHRPEWDEELLAIAASCFRYSRFHLDPLVGAAAANRVKREWIRSYVEGRRGETLLVASAGNRPAGFLALMMVERNGKKVGVIDLVGVAPDCQGRGIGKHLVSAAIDAVRGHADVIEVGTQSANIPSVRLYEGMGFQLVRSGFVMHLHAAAT